MKLRLPNVPPGARFRLNRSIRSPYVCSSAVAAPITPANASAATSARARPARATHACAPEARRAGERQRHGAGGQPPVRREERREHAQHEERREKLVDPSQAQRSRSTQAEERGEHRNHVQHQLLRHEEPIELELLVDRRGEDDGQSSRLQEKEHSALGRRDGRRWRVGADGIGMKHPGMYARARLSAPPETRRGRPIGAPSSRATPSRVSARESLARSKVPVSST